jgi:hypothetical protein
MNTDTKIKLWSHLFLTGITDVTQLMLLFSLYESIPIHLLVSLQTPALKLCMLLHRALEAREMLNMESSYITPLLHMKQVGIQQCSRHIQRSRVWILAMGFHTFLSVSKQIPRWHFHRGTALSLHVFCNSWVILSHDIIHHSTEQWYSSTLVPGANLNWEHHFN